MRFTVGESNDGAYLTIDGQRGYMLGPDDEIEVARSDRPLRLFVAPERDIFEVMRTKLSWGERARV